MCEQKVLLLRGVKISRRIPRKRQNSSDLNGLSETWGWMTSSLSLSMTFWTRIPDNLNLPPLM
jgi:hypothetical protein